MLTRWTDAPQGLEPCEDFFSTPIFVQNFNNLTYLQRLVAWLLAAGYRNICVIDNNSTYAPLLAFYENIEINTPVQIFRRSVNGSRTSLWDEGLLERFAVTGPFVYTDSDVVPDQTCPADVVAHLAGLLRDFPHILKAGLSLRIDNLPTSYRFRNEVFGWEKQFWTTPVCRDAFLAPIDTTFALYRPNSAFAMRPALRTGFPYLARHETWYQDLANLSEEELYYRSEVEKTSRGHWARIHLSEGIAAAAAAGLAADVKLLHLGCGRKVLPGWINLDRVAGAGVDLVFDLEACGATGLPLEAGSVSGLLMGPAFQKIAAALPLMQELHRVAKPNARFIMRLGPEAVRDTMTAGLPIDFTHYGQPAFAGSNDAYSGDWRVERAKFVVDQNLVDLLDTSEIIARIRRGMIVVKELILEFRAMKPARPRQLHLRESPMPSVSGSRYDAESDFQAALRPSEIQA